MHVGTFVSVINVASNRYVVSGILPGGEVFSFGWRTTADGAGQTAASLATHLGRVQVYLAGANGLAIRQLLNNNMSFTKLDAYYVPANTNASSYQASLPVSIAGASANILTNQTALCVTLLTNVAGRRGKGRVFLPADGANLSSGAQLSAPSPATVATSVAGLLTSVFTGAAALVASPTAGTAAVVTSTRVDSRLDVIRARANKQAAAVVASAPVTVP